MVAGHLQIKKGYYYMVLNLKDENGNRKTKWLPTGIKEGSKKNEKQANDMLQETRLTYKETVACKSDDDISKITGDMLFSDYMTEWLEIVRNSIEEDTYAGYDLNISRKIVPYFRKLGVTLEQLTALDIEGFYTYCFNKLNLKGSTVQHYHANIHKALKYAAKHDLITVNPMAKVERPQSTKYVGGFYTLSEVEKLFEEVKGDPIEFPVLMAAFYGLRRSEVMGLRWQSIDFDSNTITIEHKVVQFSYKGEQRIISKDKLKNQSSFRSLPLVPQFRDLLLSIKARQENCRQICGNCYENNEYIYVNDLGQQYKPNYVTQHFKLVLEKKGLRHIRYHDLRHTCASLLLKNGVSMKDIQAWLGHSDFSTTANIYAHLETTSKNESAEKMASVICINPSICATV